MGSWGMRLRALGASALVLCLAGCPRSEPGTAGGGPETGPAEPAVAEAQPGELEPDRADLPGIRERGTLRILLFGRGDRLLPRSGDPAFQDEEMAIAFARSLGLEPVLYRVESQEVLIPELIAGRGDLVAAQLTVTPERAQTVAFSRGRRTVDEVLVGPKGSELTELDQLQGLSVHVRPTSSYAATLARVEREEEIDVEVVAADSDRTTLELILDVAEGRIPWTVADRNILAAVTEFEDRVEGALTLAEDRELAWAVRRDAEQLLAAVDRFVQERALTRHSRSPYAADLDEIRERGVLRVLTRNNAINYFLYRGQQFGFEYELMELFAERLDVRLQVVVVPRRDRLIPWLLEGRGDVIAASLTDTEARQAKVRFSEPYLYARQILVRRAGADGPDRLEELAGRTVHVRKSSSFHDDLVRLRQSGIELEIAIVDESVETEELIDRVAEGEIELTVADSHILDVELAYGEGVEAAFEIPAEPRTAAVDAPSGDAGPDGGAEGEDAAPVRIAFATRPGDEQLGERLDEFVESTYRGLRYNIARKRYFENPRRFRTGRYQATSKTGQISPYDELIRRHARRYQLDWRLMAAQAFVESRFDPDAESWVGAKGLFQVMPRTGRSMGFTKLEVPAQGIHAGIKYMHRLVQRFDVDIPLEQRLHFALAAYNAGLGHVHDARRLARQLGKDPDRWFDHVEVAMLKLSEPKYARSARHGFCRGGQPVAYIRHIQEKYEAYVKATD